MSHCLSSSPPGRRRDSFDLTTTEMNRTRRPTDTSERRVPKPHRDSDSTRHYHCCHTSRRQSHWSHNQRRPADVGLDLLDNASKKGNDTKMPPSPDPEPGSRVSPEETQTRVGQGTWLPNNASMELNDARGHRRCRFRNHRNRAFARSLSSSTRMHLPHPTSSRRRCHPATSEKPP